MEIHPNMLIALDAEFDRSHREEIHNGSIIRDSADRAAAETVNLRFKEHVLVGVAMVRIVAYKNVGMLIEAFAQSSEAKAAHFLDYNC